jgi:hypothetical protein
MYRGGALGIFSDESYESGVAEVSLNFVGFGTFFFDFDNDGLLDVFVGNGHIIDNIHLFNSVSTYREPNFLFRNQGGGVFREIGASLGDALSRENVARGAAPGTSTPTETSISSSPGAGRGASLENEVETAWVAFGRARRPDVEPLRGGARVTLRSRTWCDPRSEDRISYLSRKPRASFGLGETRRRYLEIRWPGRGDGGRREPRSRTRRRSRRRRRLTGHRPIGRFDLPC